MRMKPESALQSLFRAIAHPGEISLKQLAWTLGQTLVAERKDSATRQERFALLFGRPHKHRRQP